MGCLNDFKRAYKTLSDTTLHLMKKVPDGREDFTPPTGEFLTLGQLLHHLGDCQKFFRMIMEDTFRELDKNFMEYMSNHPASSRDAAMKHFTEEYEKVMKMLDEMTEEEFLEKEHYFWTVTDETMPFITYNVIEHNASHKYQLFIYLKLMGLPDIDSFALAGEDEVPKEEIMKMYEMAHQAYEEKHGIKA